MNKFFCTQTVEYPQDKPKKNIQNTYGFFRRLCFMKVSGFVFTDVMKKQMKKQNTNEKEVLILIQDKKAKLNVLMASAEYLLFTAECSEHGVVAQYEFETDKVTLLTLYRGEK
jgi:hypothetical protein